MVNRGIRDSRGLRSIFAVMLLLVLSVRSIAPTGYMPVPTSMGLVVTLCSGEAGKQIVLNIPTSGDESDHDGQRNDQPSTCAFSALTAPGLASADTPHLAPPPLPLSEIALPPPAGIVLASASYILPPLRGPPLVA